MYEPVTIFNVKKAEIAKDKIQIYALREGWH